MAEGTSGTGTDTTVSLFRQLGEDVGADSAAGKALKVTGTLADAAQGWRDALARNSSVDDVIWVAAREAWKPPLKPTQYEMERARRQLQVLLTIDNDNRCYLFKKLTFRSRSQPLVLMRLLNQNLDLAPWIATLVAAVHAGAGAAVRTWAERSLFLWASKGAVEYGLDQNATLLLLRQAPDAADAFLSDLKAVAVNEYWRAVPKSGWLARLSDLPELVHRTVADEWWSTMIEHYDGLDMPLYRLEHKVARGIEYGGQSIIDADHLHVVMTVEAFADHIQTVYVEPHRRQGLPPQSRLVLEAAGYTLIACVLHTGRDCDCASCELELGLECLLRSTSLSSRVVVLDIADNLKGLVRVRMYRRHVLERLSGPICHAVAGTSVDTPRLSGACRVVAIQTAVGLLIPTRCVLENSHSMTTVWQLQAIQLDNVKQQIALTSEDGFGHSEKTAGIGPALNRMISSDDEISGVVTLSAQSLEALCIIRDEMYTIPFHYILNRLIGLRRLSPGEERSIDVAGKMEPNFSYITSDLILQAIKRKELYSSVFTTLPLFLTGEDLDWQLLALAVSEDEVIVQGRTDATVMALFDSKALRGHAFIAGPNLTQQ